MPLELDCTGIYILAVFSSQGSQYSKASVNRKVDRCPGTRQASGEPNTHQENKDEEEEEEKEEELEEEE